MNTAGKIALGIAGAAAAGALLGMLVAPTKGSELTKNISKKSGQLFNQFVDMLSAKPATAKTAKASATHHRQTSAHKSKA